MEHKRTEQFRLEAELHARLRRIRDARKAVVWGLRATREAFGAPEGAVAIRKPGRRRTDVVFRMPRDSDWSGELFAEYLDGRRAGLPSDLVLAPIERRGRGWAVLALRDPGTNLMARRKESVHAVAQILTEAIGSMDRSRTRQVRQRIQKTIADGRESQDLIYNILHGLRCTDSRSDGGFVPDCGRCSVRRSGAV